MSMKIYLTGAIIALAISACNSGKSKEETEPVKEDTAVMMRPGQNSRTAGPNYTDTVPGNEWEKIGDLSLGMKASNTTELLGQPSSKSKAEEWGADGMMHQDWFYKDKGIALNMASDKDLADQHIFSITITSPCAFKTKKGMGIGSSYAEVMAAYEKEIDRSAIDKTTITVGSVYGGIIFDFKNDKADRVFVGAAAE
jgi:hypothetical protein